MKYQKFLFYFLMLNFAFATVAQSKSTLSMFLFDRDRASSLRVSDLKIARSLAQEVGLRFGRTLYSSRFLNYELPKIAYQKFFIHENIDLHFSQLEKIYLPELTRGETTPTWVSTKLDEDLRKLIFSVADKGLEEIDKKLVFIFGNLTYHLEAGVVGGKSSENAYLGDGWLTYANSPFFKNVISLTGRNLEGAEIFVFTDSAMKPSVRQGNERFYKVLFDKIGANLNYYGPYYTQNGTETLFPLNLMKNIFNKNILVTPPSNPKAATILQFIDTNGNGETITLSQ